MQENLLLEWAVDVGMVPTDIEKCLNLNAVLKSAWFCNLPGKWENLPWKVLENDYMVLKNVSTRKSNLLVCHFAHLNWEKQHDSVILSSNLHHCWSSELCFLQCKLPNPSFLYKILCRCVFNWKIKCEYFNLMYGKLFCRRITHLQYAI